MSVEIPEFPRIATEGSSDRDVLGCLANVGRPDGDLPMIGICPVIDRKIAVNDKGYCAEFRCRSNYTRMLLGETPAGQS